MLLIIAAVPLETKLLRQQFQTERTEQLGSCQISFGLLCGKKTILSHSGVGQTAMALHLTRLLERYQIDAVLLCGCGGSYPDSGLRNGDLALASAETFGDLGVCTESSFIHLTELDIPQQPNQMLAALQTYQLMSELTVLAQHLLPEAHIGPFVTISSCSGHPALSTELQQRTCGICENMEGAAAAQVCSEYQLPLLELRGISNPTGTRDTAQWDIKLGAETAQQGILKILQHWQTELD